MPKIRETKTRRVGWAKRELIAVDRLADDVIGSAEDQSRERERTGGDIRNAHESTERPDGTGATIANGISQLVAAGLADGHERGVHEAALDRLVSQRVLELDIESSADGVDLRSVAVEHNSDEIGRCGSASIRIGGEGERLRVDVQHRSNEHPV